MSRVLEGKLPPRGYILPHPSSEMRSTKKATMAECATSVHLWRQILWFCADESTLRGESRLRGTIFTTREPFSNRTNYRLMFG